MKIKLFTVLCCCWTILLSAQSDQVVPCGLDHVHQLYAKDHPGFTAELEAYRQTLPQRAVASDRSGAAIISIPVVVHVINNGEAVGSGTNLSTSRVQSQIDVLNEDYRRRNDDASQTPSTYNNVAADAEIEFCLATIDPNGNPSNGITRHTYNNISSINFIEQQLKPATNWDPNRYLNIWTLQMPDNSILGYSYLPTVNIVGTDRDGIVISYDKFGYVNNTNRGRTTTHEMGHYLGLMHVWGANDSSGDPIGCGSDDGASDTPNSDGPYYFCPNFGSASCGSTDMNMNFMDYVDDHCMNLFTEGQKNLMHSTLTGIRSSLLDDNLAICNINIEDCISLSGADITMGFEDNQSTDDWAIVDNNGDGVGWNLRQDFTTDWGPNNGSGLAVYFWNEDGVSAADDYLFTPCFSVISGHVYQLKFAYAAASDENGTIYPEKLEVGFSGNQSPSDFFNFDDWVFDPVTNDYPNYNSENLTFQATEDGSLSIGFHVFSTPDQYAMQIDDIRIVDLSDISPTAEVLQVPKIRLYPNPVRDQLQVELDFSQNEKALDISLYDPLGQLVLHKTFHNITSNKLTLDLSALPTGIYFVNINAGAIQQTQKIILSH